MSANRQDAWRKEEDQLLIEVTLRQIREGGTQLSAFEEVGRRLGRTPNACGFRWNSTIRKMVEKEIREAKMKRAKGKKRGKGFEAEEAIGDNREAERKTDMMERPFSFAEMMNALQWHQRRFEEIEKEMAIRDAKIAELLRETERLTLEFRRITDKAKQLSEENHRLIAEKEQLLTQNQSLRERIDQTIPLGEGYDQLVEAPQKARGKRAVSD